MFPVPPSETYTERSSWLSPISSCVGMAPEPIMHGPFLYRILQPIQIHTSSIQTYLPVVEKVRALNIHKKIYREIGTCSMLFGSAILIHNGIEERVRRTFSSIYQRAPNNAESVAISVIAGIGTTPFINGVRVFERTQKTVKEKPDISHALHPGYKGICFPLMQESVLKTLSKGMGSMATREGIQIIMVLSGWKSIQPWILSHTNMSEEQSKLIARLIAGASGSILSQRVAWAQKKLTVRQPYILRGLVSQGFRGVIPRAARYGVFSAAAGAVIDNLSALFSRMKLREEESTADTKEDM